MLRPRNRHFLLLMLFLSATCLFPVGVAREATAASYTRTVERYDVPDVVLTNQDGRKVRLRKLLLGDKPVLVNFVYTTCTTICPVLSANFKNFQRKLDHQSSRAQLVSISIDPENDTPRAMKKYLAQYKAQPGWEFLTGSRDDIDKVIWAFGALYLYDQNKMEHYPLVLLRSPADGRWVRIYGLIGTSELIKEFEEVER
jgi:protein SCO1/2